MREVEAMYLEEGALPVNLRRMWFHVRKGGAGERFIVRVRYIREYQDAGGGRTHAKGKSGAQCRPLDQHPLG